MSTTSSRLRRRLPRLLAAALLLLALPGCLTMTVRKGLIGSGGFGARRQAWSSPTRVVATRTEDTLILHVQYPSTESSRRAWRPDGRMLEVADLAHATEHSRDEASASWPIADGPVDRGPGLVLCREGTVLAAYGDGTWLGSVDLVQRSKDTAGSKGALLAAAVLVAPAFALDVTTFPLQVLAAIFGVNVGY